MKSPVSVIILTLNEEIYNDTISRFKNGATI